MDELPPNDALELTAPLGAALGNEMMLRSASRAFARRRRSSTRCYANTRATSGMILREP